MTEKRKVDKILETLNNLGFEDVTVFGPNGNVASNDEDITSIMDVAEKISRSNCKGDDPWKEIVVDFLAEQAADNGKIPTAYEILRDCLRIEPNEINRLRLDSILEDIGFSSFMKEVSKENKPLFTRDNKGGLKKCFSNTVLLIKMNEEFMLAAKENNNIPPESKTAWTVMGLHLKYWLSYEKLYEANLDDILHAMIYILSE